MTLNPAAPAPMPAPAPTRVPFPVSVTYLQLYREGRQRNDRERNATARIQVHFPAVSADDAPLLATLSTPLTDDTTYERPWRIYQGQVHQQCRHQTRNVSGQQDLYAPATPQHLADMSHNRYSRTKARSDLDVQREVQNKLDERRLVMIDGHLYEPSGEPVIVVDAEYTCVELGEFNQDGRVVSSRFRGHAPGHVFRLDQRNAALNRLREVNQTPRYHPRYTHVPKPEEDLLALMQAIPRALRPDLLRYGELKAFDVTVDISGTVTVTAHAVHGTDARKAAQAQVEAAFTHLLTQASVHSKDAVLITQSPQVFKGHVTLTGKPLTLSGAHLTYAGQGYLLTHLRGLSVLHAATLLLTNPAAGTATPAERLAPLILAPADAQGILDALLRSGGAFTQRALRGLLDPALHARLVSAIHACCAAEPSETA